jgi:hypothetical protein
MIKKRFSFGEYIYVFIIRHYWDSEEMKERPWSTEFRKFHLGLFVSNLSSKFDKSKSGRGISKYLLGINLLVIKSWVVISLPNFLKNDKKRKV